MARVLIVDDEFGLANLLGEILTDEGHLIRTASNGQQALEQATAERPDLIVTDMMMPVLDGAGLIKALGAKPELANVPVIVMSSLMETTVAARCAGYVAFVRKPFKIDELLTLVSHFSAESSGT